MYYLMLSRAQEMEQIYMKMPVHEKTREVLKLKIKANPDSLLENNKLIQRSIVPSYHEKDFCVFMVNIDSLKNKIIELTNDTYV